MRLKEIREKRGMSQKDLAVASGVNIQMIQHYEQEVRDINKAQVRTLHKLSKALDCAVEELIEIERL